MNSRRLVFSLFHLIYSAVANADVVVCGGGISGTSIAYHLAKRGKKVALVEKDSIGCSGATGLSAGLVSAPIFWQDTSLQAIAQASLDLYSHLAKTCKFRYVKCGRTYLASSMANEILLRRMYSRGVVHSDKVELLDCQSEMLERWPFLQTEDVQLALFSPEDVALDPVALCQHLALIAKDHGALIYESNPVLEVHIGDEKQVYGVSTKMGFIETSHFVDAAGIWAGSHLVKALPHQHVQTAAYPCTYSYIHTSKLPTGSVSDMTPIFNDLDGNIMLRTTSFKTLCAGFAEESIRPLARQTGAATSWQHPEPDWNTFVASEYEACRERVGLMDMSSFSKYDITGEDAVEYLQFLCSANVDEPIGTTVYTGMQHQKGGYVTDCTLSRLGEKKFFMVAPTIQQERVLVWMKKWQAILKARVHVQDVTGAYTALDLIGPSSRYLMGDITGLSMSSNDFPTFRCQEINIGMATGIRAISVTHCGELGWVIYIPNEVAQNVYEKLLQAGKEYSLQHAGYYTLRQLRIEKFYVYWGQDINATVTPVECSDLNSNRNILSDFQKDFIGKKALEDQVERGVSKRFVQLLVDGHDKETDPWPQGGETILKNGRPVGLTTSAAYGFTLGCQVCIGYVENKEFGVSPEFVSSGHFEIDIAGKRFTCRLNVHSPSLPMISSEHPLHYRPTQ
ncbi:hypothetical protein CAEBREN_31204 [Caenorhabditis brenneri]|uniref:Uncharacterized protein n=1 Tax=Caenorhabditis brenneri TaxID=135651 RepID=G0NXY0_CAEBE|nr:hypothetical protein CAEBREN_31204 [Caenorhabditis brenneri]